MSLLVAVLLLGAGRDARAAPEDALRFSVDPRAKGCPTAEAFRTEVARHMGEDEAAPPSLEHRPIVTVHIDLVGGELRARIDVDEPPSTAAAPVARHQVLRAPTYACRDLTSAAAIAASLVLRAADVRASEEPLPSPAPLSEPAPAPEPSSPDVRGAPPARSAPIRPPSVKEPPRPRTRPTTSLRHALFAGALAGKTIVPDLGIGTVAGYTASWGRRFALTIEASAVLPREAEGAHRAGVRVTSRTIALAPCLRHGVLFGCASTALGSTVGTGVRVESPETHAFLHIELGLRAGARVPLTRPFALRAELRGGVPLFRSRFLVESDTVWRTPAATLTGMAALETTF